MTDKIEANKTLSRAGLSLIDVVVVELSSRDKRKLYLLARTIARQRFRRRKLMIIY